MDISKIEASLNYGIFLSGIRLTVLKICLVVALIFPLITVFIIITVLIGGMVWSYNMIFALVAGNVFSLFLFAVLLFVKISNDKLRKKIILWMEDALELKAVVKRLDIVSPKYKPYQVEVRFEIVGKKYRRISASGNVLKGYNKIFAKYNDKIISILYSVKYDQVLLLKQVN